VRRKRTDADELLEQFDHFRIREISPATKELTADDLRMLSEMAIGSSLTLRRKNRLELFFDDRGHGQAFDDHAVQCGPGIGCKVIRVFSASATNSGSFSVFRKAASTARTRSRGTPGGIA
jgi:hypothetical protein